MLKFLQLYGWGEMMNASRSLLLFC